MTEERATIRLGVSGATGRLGRLVMDLADRDTRIEPSALPRGIAGVTTPRRPARTPPEVDVIVDVSSDAGCRAAIETAELKGVPIVIGTTGLSPETLASAHRLASRVAVMIAPNLSRGALLLRRLVAMAAQLAPSEWPFDLIETHRAEKRDAPSGTAIAIASESIDPNGASRLEGRIASIRTGDVVGEHRVRIVGTGEELVLEHRAVDRTVFARGALEAAVWLTTRRPGMHPFESCLEPRTDGDQESGSSDA